MKNRHLALLAVPLLGVAAVAGCSGYKDDRGIGDAPSEQQPDQNVKIWPNADHYPNIAVLCVGGNGVYTTTREAPPAVVPNDPECAEGGVLDD